MYREKPRRQRIGAVGADCSLGKNHAMERHRGELEDSAHAAIAHSEMKPSYTDTATGQTCMSDLARYAAAAKGVVEEGVRRNSVGNATTPHVADAYIPSDWEFDLATGGIVEGWRHQRCHCS